jgi:EAP30/Vps36 family
VRHVESTAQSARLDMDDALKDLDALMVKAREMVRLAGELNDRLTTMSELNATSDGAEPETATFIRSSLAQLGLQMTDVPVTLDMARDEKRWYEQLARELAAVLQGTGGKSGAGMMGDRGIIPLDEVWGGWNRARGVGEAAYILRHARPPVLNTRARSSLDSLTIFAGTAPFTDIYGPNDHGAHIPRQRPACSAHAHLHTSRLCCASSWDVTHIGRSHYAGGCARGRCSYWSCV